MLEYLNELDTNALLALNGLNNSFQDALWFLMSNKLASLLIVLGLIWILLHKNRRHALLVVAMLVLAIAISDQISSGLIKHLVERLRPTREPSLGALIHTVNDYRGGMYGFVSSHAANSFAAATLLSFVMRQRLTAFSLFAWALLQCYSRIYLGVHYPGDIVCGTALGFFAAWIGYLVLQWIGKKRPKWGTIDFTEGESRQMIWATVINVGLLALLAIFITTT